MEVYTDPKRHYRVLESSNTEEQKFQVILEESDLLLTLPSFINESDVIEISTKFLYKIRQDIKFHIQNYPDFLHSLIPISAPKNIEKNINVMYDVAKIANVGPFATIAGTVAQLMTSLLVFWIKKNYASHQNVINNAFSVIVENGGDIYVYSHKERIVGVLSNPKLNQNIGIKILKSDFPTSLCSSSSKIGHSLSFGNGDIAMVKAKNAALADALATAYCNMLKTSKDINKVIDLAKKHSKILAINNPFNYQELLEFIEVYSEFKNYHNLFDLHSKSGLEGIFLQCDEHIGIWGDLELVALA